jgi:hypothetical protein
MDALDSESSAQKTLWQGELDSAFDEEYLKALWKSYGEHVIVKMIKDRYSGYVLFLLKNIFISLYQTNAHIVPMPDIALWSLKHRRLRRR